MVNKTRRDSSLAEQEIHPDPIAASFERFFDDLRVEAIAFQFGTIVRRIFNRCDFRSPFAGIDFKADDEFDGLANSGEQSEFKKIGFVVWSPLMASIVLFLTVGVRKERTS